MRSLHLPLVLLTGVAMVAACSDDETDRVKPDSGSAGTAGSGSGGKGGSGGAGGSGATGGSSATGGAGGSGGTGATGGSAGAAGAVGAAGAADASIDGDAADGGLFCPPLPVPDGGSAGAAADAGVNADASGTIDQWRDWAANSCVTCPAGDVLCEETDGPASSFDSSTRIVTLTLDDGVAEIVSGTVEIYWYALDQDGGFIEGTANGTLSVDRNTLSADLSADVPAGVYQINVVRVELDDACGTHSIISDYRYTTDVEAGAVVNIHCET